MVETLEGKPHIYFKNGEWRVINTSNSLLWKVYEAVDFVMTLNGDYEDE